VLLGFTFALGINVSRAVGPAIGGVVVATAGPATAFLLNAASFLGVIAALVWWRREPRRSMLPGERFMGALRAGLRYTRGSPPLQATPVRSVAFFIFAAAPWTLLPLVVSESLRAQASTYGALLACIGVGAVTGALAMPLVRSRISRNALVGGAIVGCAASSAVLGLVRDAYALGVALLIFGAMWIAVLSTLQVAAQTAVPAWVRGRALSVYQLAFGAGMAGGSLLWGWVAKRAGLDAALLGAAAGAVLALAATLRVRLGEDESAGLIPSNHWPAPEFALPSGTEAAFERGPVLVTVRYRIDPARSADFLAALETLARERRRDGALSGGVYEDAAQPGSWLEVFALESWLEHLRQHERVTLADRDAQERVHAFHIEESAPQVSHYLAQQPGPD
jgi:MFS family permease